MSKKLHILKLTALIVFYTTYIIGILVKPFKFVYHNKKSEMVSIFDYDFKKYFGGLKAFLIVMLVVTFIVLVMLVICLIGELVANKKGSMKSFLSKFGYKLEDKEVKQFSYILTVIMNINFAIHGIKYKPDTFLEVKLSTLTPTFLVFGIVMFVTLVIVHLGKKERKVEKEQDLL